MSEEDTNGQTRKPKTYGPAIASLVLGIFAVVIMMTSILTEPWIVSPSFFLFFLFAIIGFILGTGALVKIVRSKGQLTGSVSAVFGIIINTFLIIFCLIPRVHVYGPPDPRIICAWNLRGLGMAMLVYANDYDDRYPTADKWCDLLIEYADVRPKQFICRGSGAIRGESSYAFNKNIVGMKVSEVPSDVVLLFETNFGKDPNGRQGRLADRDFHKFLEGYSASQEKVYKLRWNQVGGPQILTFENHEGKGCNVLFNNWHVEFIKPEQLEELKWQVEQSK